MNAGLNVNKLTVPAAVMCLKTVAAGFDYLFYVQGKFFRVFVAFDVMDGLTKKFLAVIADEAAVDIVGSDKTSLVV